MMLWEKLSKRDSGDYRVLKLAYSMLDSDMGLSEDQFDDLREFVYDEIGPTVEMQDLFNQVDATNGRFYMKVSVSRAS